MPLQTVLGGMKALVVDPFGPMSECLGLHHFDKTPQVIFRSGNICRCNAPLVLHSFHAIVDPGLEKQLTGGVDLERFGRLKNCCPKLFIQSCGGHNLLPFFRPDQAPT